MNAGEEGRPSCSPSLRGQDWAADTPKYRVYFWTRLDGDGWKSDESELDAADVTEAIT